MESRQTTNLTRARAGRQEGPLPPADQRQREGKVRSEGNVQGEGQRQQRQQGARAPGGTAARNEEEEAQGRQ